MHVTLEDNGFCAKRDDGPFVEDAKLGPGGGQFSAFYMPGITPLSEGVIHARVNGGGRHVDAHDIILGSGGTLGHHSTLVLSPHAE